MNADHTRYAQWDAAYVLGALSATERREYEEHAATCAQCQAAIAELAPTAALLSRVSGVSGDANAAPAPQLRQSVIDLAEQRALRRRTRWWVAGVAAAVIALTAITIPLALSIRPSTSVAMTNVSDAPLEASVVLTDVPWGTKIDLDCAYPMTDDHAYDDSETYTLAVIDEYGATAPVSTWKAGPGSDSQLSAGTALARDEITAIEIHSAEGEVLLKLNVTQ